MSKLSSTCDCGQAALPGALQCRACRKAAVAKWIKIAAIVGALLGFACSRLPSDYQGPCHTVASLLTSCTP